MPPLSEGIRHGVCVLAVFRFHRHVCMIEVRVKFIPHQIGTLHKMHQRYFVHTRLQGKGLLRLFHADDRFRGFACIVDMHDKLHLSALAVRIRLYLFDGNRIFSCQLHFANDTIPTDLRMVRIGMRHSSCRDSIAFAVIHPHRDAMFSGREISRQIVTVRRHKALLRLFHRLTVDPYRGSPNDPLQFQLHLLAIPSLRNLDLFAVPSRSDIAMFARQMQYLRLLYRRRQGIGNAITRIIRRTRQGNDIRKRLRRPLLRNAHIQTIQRKCPLALQRHFRGRMATGTKA